MRPFAAILLLALPLLGQRAQLARKGRQPDSARPLAVEPLRKLPRRRTVIAAPAATSLPRPVQAPPTLSEDRVRPLVRGGVTPLPAAPLVDDLARTLPRVPADVVPPNAALASVQAESIRNRWKIFPTAPWRRYDDKHLDAIYAASRYWDPFNRNTLKGDYPVIGRKLFFAFTGTSDTTFETKRIPVPSQASSGAAGEFAFYGDGRQSLTQQNFRFSFDLFHGAAGFKPVDWEVRVTPEFNINYLRARETGQINVDVSRGLDRISISLRFVQASNASPATSADLSSATNSPARASSAPSTTTSSNTTWRTST